MYQLAEMLGFGKELVKYYKMVKGKGGMMEPECESILREFNQGMWTIGYTGQSPERLKARSTPKLARKLPPPSMTCLEVSYRLGDPGCLSSGVP